MANTKRKKLKLNVKFMNGVVVCAKSPKECRSCNEISKCEKMELFYYPFSKKDIRECFKNNEKKM